MLLDTPVCNFGWDAPEFSLADFDGKEYVMREQMGENGLLIAFICNHCPYVLAIIDRFIDDARELQASGINVLAVMSNDYTYVPADHPDKMREFAKEHGFFFPYVIDEGQEVAKSYDAVCTPDFFGLNREGKLQYRGRLDNLRMQDQGEREQELVNAMRLVAETGAGPEQQYASMGCSIKWKG